MNSPVRPIFNESVVKKNRFMDTVNSIRDPLEKLTGHRNGLKKKKKKCQNADTAFIISIQMGTKCVFGGCLSLLGLDILIGSSI